MITQAKKRARRWETHQQKRSAQLHAENRARILREREAMAERWMPSDRTYLPLDKPEQVFAAAFAAMGRDFGGTVERRACA
jgi:hypothetical protein